MSGIPGTHQEAKVLKTEIWGTIEVIDETPRSADQNINFALATEETIVGRVKYEYQSTQLLIHLVSLPNNRRLFMMERVLARSYTNLKLQVSLKRKHRHRNEP